MAGGSGPELPGGGVEQHGRVLELLREMLEVWLGRTLCGLAGWGLVGRLLCSGNRRLSGRTLLVSDEWLTSQTLGGRLHREGLDVDAVWTHYPAQRWILDGVEHVGNRVAAAPAHVTLGISQHRFEDGFVEAGLGNFAADEVVVLGDQTHPVHGAILEKSWIVILRTLLKSGHDWKAFQLGGRVGNIILVVLVRGLLEIKLRVGHFGSEGELNPPNFCSLQLR